MRQSMAVAGAPVMVTSPDPAIVQFHAAAPAVLRVHTAFRSPASMTDPAPLATSKIQTAAFVDDVAVTTTLWTLTRLPTVSDPSTAGVALFVVSGGVSRSSMSAAILDAQRRMTWPLM